MTDSGAPQTIKPAVELLTGATNALWATTYNVDLSLFNEFLLPRLGGPPLNIAILADHERLATSLDRIPIERADSLALVNRRWVLRGMKLGLAFHPKTYISVSTSRVTLLVGSGNLSRYGFDDGHEVFTVFKSGSADGNSAIAAWQSWMRRLIGLVGDSVLAERFKDLETRIARHVRSAEISDARLLHNLDSPILQQFVAIAEQDGARTEELWLAAPFYDQDAVAVGALLDAFKPRRVRVFVTTATSVDGRRLADRLTASGAESVVASYDPDRFIHAKLVGVISEHGGWLLSGSPNLSQAALTRAASAHGNVELAVIARASRDELNSAFLPPRFSYVASSLSSLVSLTFRPDTEPALAAIALHSAAALSDNRIAIVCDRPVQREWLLNDLLTSQSLTDLDDNRAVTAGPLAGRLVVLTDPAGKVLSNRVVVDDPQALAAALLAESAQQEIGRPPELAVGDTDTALGRALVWLNRNLVMDVSERANPGELGTTVGAKVGGDGDDDLWDRLEHEQLARDPRRAMYGRIWTRAASTGAEPIIELLDQLRNRAPSDGIQQSPDSVLAPLIKLPLGDSDEHRESHGHRWTASARIRVRARNVLRRWAAAQSDPRLVWVNPLAPAGNFALITWTLAYLRAERAAEPSSVELSEDDLDDLWQLWLRSFSGTGKSDGWLDQLDQSNAQLVEQDRPAWLSEVAAALCWLVVQPMRQGYRDRAVGFQAVLQAALTRDLINPTEWTAKYLSQLTGYRVLRTEIDQGLLKAIAFIDDDLWCQRTSEEMGLTQLTLVAPPSGADVQVRLDVRGISDPLLEPRVPRLVVAARRYRRSDGVVVYSQDSGWRLALATGERVMYVKDDRSPAVESAAVLEQAMLERLAAEGGVLANLFEEQTGAVA